MTSTKLGKGDTYAAADLRRVKPGKAAQRANQGIDVMRVWLDDIEHAIRVREIPAELADEFRALAGA